MCRLLVFKKNNTVEQSISTLKGKSSSRNEELTTVSIYVYLQLK